MLNIIMLLIAATTVVIGLAKKGRGRRSFAKFIQGQIDTDLNLTTLAAKTLVGEVTSQTVVDTARVGSIACTYSLADLTVSANVGPITFGVAHSDYSDAEVEAWVENQGGWDIGNMVDREIGARRIRQIGVFLSGNGPTLNAVFNDGRVTKTKLNWILSEGDGLRFWCYNSGNAAIATTVPNFNVLGVANIWYS